MVADQSTVQSLTASIVPQIALLPNFRKGGMLYNDADQGCYVKLGSGVTPTSFTLRLHKKDSEGVGDVLNLGALRVFTGPIEVVWDAGVVGALRVTEVT